MSKIFQLPVFSQLLVLFAIVVLMSCSGVPLKSQSEGIPFVGQFEVDRYVLENGLKVLILEDDTSPTFAFQVWYNVGSKDEQEGLTGLAHLFEHMMFRKTRNLKEGEFNILLEQAGVRGKNAFTEQDLTAYFQELPKDKLELIIRLEAERLRNLIIDEPTFQNEIKVVLNELSYRYDNNPTALMFRELFLTAFEKHPYRNPIGGFPRDLKRMSAKDAMDFHSRFYTPNNALVVAVGDVDSGDAIDLIQKYFGTIPAREILRPKLPEEPPATRPKIKSMRLDLQTEKLIIAYPAPAIDDPDIAALDVLQGVLTDGRASRLNRALVETGIATGVYSGRWGLAGPSLFMVVVTLQKGARATKAANIVYREIEALKKQGVTEPELERARNVLDFGFYNMLVSNIGKARFLGDTEIKGGGFERGLEVREAISRIKGEAVVAAAHRYLKPEQRTVIIGTPK